MQPYVWVTRGWRDAGSFCVFVKTCGVLSRRMSHESPRFGRHRVGSGILHFQRCRVGESLEKVIEDTELCTVGELPCLSYSAMKVVSSIARPPLHPFGLLVPVPWASLLAVHPAWNVLCPDISSLTPSASLGPPQ